MRSLIVLGLVCLASVVYTDSGENPLLASVPDNKLTASSFWCQGDRIASCESAGVSDGGSAKYARLSSTGSYTGGWIAYTQDENQYIQVEFGGPVYLTGIVLKARDYGPEHVTQFVRLFKFKRSSDCTRFTTLKDTSGEDKLFEGNTDVNEEKTIRFTSANGYIGRCFQINPIVWESYISLRFDLLGVSL